MKRVSRIVMALVLVAAMVGLAAPAKAAITVTSADYGPGVRLVTVTGITAVAASTKGSAETIDLTGHIGGSVATASRLIGVQVKTATSTDFDVVLGTVSTIDLTATAGYYQCTWVATTMNIGTFDYFENDPRPLVDADGKVYFRLKNDDGANATGAVSLILWVKY